MDKCIACGACTAKCPKKVVNEFDGRLSKRKAVYVDYAQAVPLKYAIDDSQCFFLTKGKCKKCETVCPTGAINYDDTAQDLSINVGAVIFSSGCKPYDPSTHDVYGYNSSKNIVTSLEFERILSSSGPFGGHLVRPSDNKEPKKIAWLQCVGSRDVHIGAKGYCSSVCCTYAVKEAMLAKEHAKNGLDAAVFYMDIRTHGKEFEQYYNRAKDEFGVRFVKSKITNIVPTEDGNQLLRYIDESGNLAEEEFDIVVLSVGLEVGQSAIKLADKLGTKLDKYNFVSTSSFSPVSTTKPGVYTCGAIEAPKDIPSSVIEASASAGSAGSALSESRWTLTKTKETPSELDIRGERPRIGVFICCCGTNIAGVVDVPGVVEYVKDLPYVTFSDQGLFSCSQDALNNLAATIEKQKLNRVVVAACTPKTHEPLFQETLGTTGLNKYVFEMVNIRNQCSWVHKDNHELATEKAKDLVRMAVEKVALMGPLKEVELEINQTALVIGGGIAGLQSAKTLSEQGYHAHIIEREERLGGKGLSIHETWMGENVAENVDQLITAVENDDNIEVHKASEIKHVDGFVGNFTTTIQSSDATVDIEHGVTIIASGANELKPDQYLYGEDDRVMTGLELDRKIITGDASLEDTQTVVFIQCVGSRIPERPYCSKVCCTHSIKNALTLKKGKPDMEIYILYRDMRTYGLREDLYREAREKGIKFLRYNFTKGIEVDYNGDDLQVDFTDTVMRRKMAIKTDMLVLATAIIPPRKNPLAQMYKVTLNNDSFFMEAHAKLRPVDCSTDGVFLCGLSHGPKPIDESVSQAIAAATRAVTLLARKTISISGTVAEVNPKDCSECGGCVSICPYSAPSLIEESARFFPGRAQINPALCKGCGLCVASCRSGAIRLHGFDNDQILSQIAAISE